MNKSKKSILLLFFCAQIVSIWAQKFHTGLIIDEDAYRRIPRQSLYGDGGKSENKALDGIYKADLKPFCPKVGHQGSIGSCVGWSSGYAALTIAEAIRDNNAGKQDEINRNANSALFVYNQIKIGDCGQGARIEDAMAFLKKKGDTPAKNFDLVIENCERQATEKDFTLAASHRIQDYVTLFDAEGSDLVKINKIKLSLVQKKPVVVAVELNENFESVRKGDTFWFPEIGNTNPLGAHAMCVVGFDDGKDAFEIMNSWGDYWGEDGFIWIKYKDFIKRCYHAYQFTLPKAKQENNSITPVVTKNYTGEFAFRFPKTTFNGKVEFEYADATFNGRYYELTQKGWHIGERFQLVSKEVQAEMYLYVLSYDPSGELKVHWPRDENLDAKFSGTRESAMITTPEVELVIPSATKVLQYNKSGKDYIVVLYAPKPIDNLNEKLATLKKDKKGDLYAKIYKAFGNQIIQTKDLSYNANKMSCSSNSNFKTEYILPIILEVSVKDK